MVRPLDPCEVDFFGDLAGDTHGLWEVFEFVRLHHSDLSDKQVFERGRQYLADWIDAGWIRVSDAPLHPSTITSLAQIPAFLQRHGPAAIRYLENSPSIDITEEAQRAYDATI
jgi:hypothetical protein